MNQQILKNSLLSILFLLAGCNYKPSNSLCKEFYAKNKVRFAQLLDIKAVLYKDSLCYTYTIEYTAKFLLRERCDSIYKVPTEPQNTQLLDEKLRGILEGFMYEGKIDLITFTMDSIIVRFKNYDDPYNKPYILLSSKEILRNSEKLDSLVYYIPMR